jgi:capsular exopolysaccharide synthesis family protein
MSIKKTRMADLASRSALSFTPEPVENMRRRLDPHLVSLLQPTSFEAEQYRTLRYLVEQKKQDAGSYILTVSSPTAGDGKTTTAINLAGALAQGTGARVLLIDADLRLPRVAKALGLTRSGEGLVGTILNRQCAFAEVLSPLGQFNLDVLPAGQPQALPYEILKSERLGELLAEVRRLYDYVILDAPPFVPFPDGRLLTRWSDGFLLVVSAHKTSRMLLGEVLNAIDSSKMIGLVFNNDNQSLVKYYKPYKKYYSSIAPRRSPGLFSRLTGLFKGTW